MNLYYIEVNVICMIVLGILLASVRNVNKEKRVSLYKYMLIATIVLCFCDMAASLLAGMSFYSVRFLLYLFNVGYFVCCFVLAFIWCIYSMQVLNGEINKKSMIVVLCITSLASILFIIAPFTKWAFYIDGSNHYVRGPLIYVHWIVSFGCIIFPSILAPFSYGDYKEKRAITAFAVLPFISAVLQVLVNGISAAQVGITCGLLLLFVMLQSRLVGEARLKASLLVELSVTDPLTKLKNRRSYDEKIESLKNEEWVGTLFADINNLKSVNDSKGHKEGDSMICKFANLLKEYFDEDEIFRVSGDEFVVLSSDKAHYENGLENIVKKVGDVASFGVKQGRGDNLLDIVSEAEREMYKNKSDFYTSGGRDRRKH